MQLVKDATALSYHFCRRPWTKQLAATQHDRDGQCNQVPDITASSRKRITPNAATEFKWARAIANSVINSITIDSFCKQAMMMH
jgi:hypothetical protein